jgi:hypothetical protein
MLCVSNGGAYVVGRYNLGEGKLICISPMNSLFPRVPRSRFFLLAGDFLVQPVTIICSSVPALCHIKPDEITNKHVRTEPALPHILRVVADRNADDFGTAWFLRRIVERSNVGVSK